MSASFYANRCTQNYASLCTAVTRFLVLPENTKNKINYAFKTS